MLQAVKRFHYLVKGGRASLLAALERSSQVLNSNSEKRATGGISMTAFGHLHPEVHPLMVQAIALARGNATPLKSPTPAGRATLGGARSRRILGHASVSEARRGRLQAAAIGGRHSEMHPIEDCIEAARHRASRGRAAAPRLRLHGVSARLTHSAHSASRSRWPCPQVRPMH